MGNFITDLFSTKPAEEAAAAKKAGYAQGLNTANTSLDTGLNAARPLYDKAYGDFSSLGTKFGAGHDAYNDATGVNGAGGIQRSTDIYRSLPGYNAGREIGIDDLERRAAARGGLGGGNMSADTIRFASDYDSGKYGNYVSSLAPNLSGSLNATSGGAGVLDREAGANLNVGGQKAQYGYGAAVGEGNAEADAKLAPYAASQNFWNAAMGVGKLALGAATGGASLALPNMGPTSIGGPSGPKPVSGGWWS